MANLASQSKKPPLLVRLEPSWKAALGEACSAAQIDELCDLLHSEQIAGRTVFPPRALIFAAFDRTPIDQVRVVIVGQDPYHGPGQAMGLSFSVPCGVPIPPSLRNIYRELIEDIGIVRPANGDLTAWTEQGVLLLNSSLTVRAGEAGSHASAGWQPITDAAIRVVSERREHVVFLLWGRHAQSKAALIDADKHLVLQAPHPSPLSASRGFFGCGHFSRANAYLVEHGQPPIDWSLPACARMR